MADFILKDDQNVDIAVVLFDGAGNAVPGEALDAGSLAAAFADGTEFTVTPAADQTSVNVKASGALTTGDVLTVSGSFNGAALTPGTIAIDVVVDLPVAVGLVPGTPTQNAPVTPPAA